MNFFMEVAKLRAAACCGPRSSSSSIRRTPSRMSLRTHSQTSGWSLTAQDVQQRGPHLHRGDGRGRAHPVAAHQRPGRGIALPTDFSARIARNTQLFLQDETASAGGRSLGRQLLRREPDRRARAGLGAHPGGRGARRHGQGHRGRHPQDAHRGGRRPHAGPHRLGQETIVGVNKYRSTEEELDVLEVDNTAVRAAGRAAGEAAAERDGAAVESAESLTRAPRRRGQPAGAGRRGRPGRATVGEISDAWRRSTAATRPRSDHQRRLQRRVGRERQDAVNGPQR
jgi:methylmalonyl-CoA mutase